LLQHRDILKEGLMDVNSTFAGTVVFLFVETQNFASLLFLYWPADVEFPYIGKKGPDELFLTKISSRAKTFYAQSGIIYF